MFFLSFPEEADFHSYKLNQVTKNLTSGEMNKEPEEIHFHNFFQHKCFMSWSSGLWGCDTM